MREARIICPAKGNDGKTLYEVRRQMEAKLIDAFGGFTRSKSMGVWNGGYEAVFVYDIAVQDTAVNNELLHIIAAWLVKAAQQEAVYLRHPDGNVRLVTEVKA